MLGLKINNVSKRGHWSYMVESAFGNKGLGTIWSLLFHSISTFDTVHCCYSAVNFLRFLQQTLHSSPVRVRCGVFFVSKISAVCFTLVTVSYIGRCYNGIELYLSPWATHFLNDFIIKKFFEIWQEIPTRILERSLNLKSDVHVQEFLILLENQRIVVKNVTHVL